MWGWGCEDKPLNHSCTFLSRLKNLRTVKIHVNVVKQQHTCSWCTQSVDITRKRVFPPHFNWHNTPSASGLRSSPPPPLMSQQEGHWSPRSGLPHGWRFAPLDWSASLSPWSKTKVSKWVLVLGYVSRTVCKSIWDKYLGKKVTQYQTSDIFLWVFAVTYFQTYKYKHAVHQTHN